MKEVVIVSAARTPFGKFGGGLKSFKAAELGGLAIAEVIKRAGISPEDVDEMIYGLCHTISITITIWIVIVIYVICIPL